MPRWFALLRQPGGYEIIGVAASQHDAERLVGLAQPVSTLIPGLAVRRESLSALGITEAEIQRWEQT